MTAFLIVFGSRQQGIRSTAGGLIGDAADDIARLVVISIVVEVTEVGSAEEGPLLVGAGVRSLEGWGGVGLLQGTEGIGNVVQFRVDGDGNFGKSDDQTNDGDGGNQHHFHRDNKTGFVIPQSL